MGSSVTVRDIARAANVSHGTVSRVLNNHPAVTEENRQRVLKAATELGYFASKSARSKAQPENRTVSELGFLLTAGVDAGEQNFWIRILRGVEAEATRHGIKILYRAIGDLIDSPDRLRTALNEMGLRSVLLVGDGDPEIVAALEDLHIQFVLVDSRVRGTTLNAVISDDYEGVYQIIKYLLDLGHERIAFIGNTVRSPRGTPIYSIECRALGYAQAMRDAGLPFEDLLLTGAGALYVNDGYAACKHLLDNGIAFTALFCASDLVAVGAIRALNEAGLRVPEDVSIIGEDSHMASLVTPHVTAMRTHPEQMGALAVRQIMSAVENPETPPLVTVLPIDLIQRQSVAPPKRRT
ncbi:MAG: LacI family DNA-binding transcriptional regulator [Chloroflexi bacterium]|uniref:LacI family DNA-binding transcriptional regulator n=1 Tax=Candidatus Flexifilum breve TaxID=3140694 RepID=UPI0031357FFD|nr:LacI family DNA-binding transcriptional regulator [Chloroflexota bacterium]MBK9747941.1 LacI family DNA-binding transcriptional regulator [Chloroflexota bacterium]